MASGIDMSTRLITLAIVIAAMGVMLVAGIGSSLGAHQGQEAAEALAVGNIALFEQLTPGMSVSSARTAFMTGFDWIISFALVGAWILAASSCVLFETFMQWRKSIPENEE